VKQLGTQCCKEHTIFKSKERPEPFKRNKKKEKLIEKRLNKLI
jgi:hypothetical protein